MKLRKVIRKALIYFQEDDDGHDLFPPRVIRQFHLTSWPDFGVPSTPRPLLELCVALMAQLGGEDAPPVVAHCSAGVGRTGTLLAVSTILKVLYECEGQVKW